MSALAAAGGQDAQPVTEVMQKATASDVARNESAADVARSTFVVARAGKEPAVLQRETAPPKALQQVEPAQPTSAVALGGTLLYRARSIWPEGSKDCSLCVEVAPVGEREPQWKQWKVELETQLVPRTVAVAPLERHILVCGEKAGRQASPGGGCVVIACRPNQDGIHASWQVPAGQGAGIRHAAWHPLSGNHIVILNTDNVIRVYNTSDSMVEPEQVIELCDADEDELTTFCFADVPMVAPSGAAFTAHGWEHVTLYALSRRGMIFGACPVLPYDCFVPLALLANAAEQTTHRHAGNTNDPAAIREASWLSAVSGSSYQRIVAVATGQRCADHSAVRMCKPTSSEHRRVQLQRLCEERADRQWCGLSCLHGTAGATVAVRVSTSGMLNIMLSASPVQPSWQQFRRGGKATTNFLDFEEHELGSPEDARPETLSQLHGKVWKQRECVLVSRDNRWSMEVSEGGECIMTAHLQDVRLTERYGQSQLPDEAREEAKYAFSLEGRVWDRRREHFVFTKWVFGSGAEQTRKKWTDQLAEKISAASNFDSFPPYQLQSSRVFRGLVVAGPKEWHAVSLPWLRELDAAASAELADQAETQQLDLSRSQLESSCCERISGFVLAASITQRERLGAEFVVLAGRQSEVAKALHGKFWTPTVATKVDDAGKEWATRIEALTNSVPSSRPSLPSDPDASSLVDFGPSFSTIRAWTDQAGSGNSSSTKMIAKSTTLPSRFSSLRAALTKDCCC